MSKGEINRKSGKIFKSRKEIQSNVSEAYLRRERKRNRILNPIPKQKGVRQIVIDAYKKNGTNGAYMALKIANSKIKKQTGVDAYPLTLVDKWIQEYEEQQAR